MLRWDIPEEMLWQVAGFVEEEINALLLLA